MEIVESVLSGKYEKIVALYLNQLFFLTTVFPDPIDSLKDSLDMC